jgi:hypothetical protein
MGLPDLPDIFAVGKQWNDSGFPAARDAGHHDPLWFCERKADGPESGRDKVQVRLDKMGQDVF